MTQKLSRGSLSMVKLTVPLAMEQFFRILVSSVDTFMLSTYSDKAVAGVGLVGQYVFFLQILFNVVGIGASIVLAQYIGAEKSEKELNYIAQASTVMITIISLVLTAVVLFGFGPLLGCYVLEEEVRQSAYDYFIIYGGYCSVFVAFSLLQSSILRSYGYTKDAMIVTIVANLINVAGNAIALYGFFGLPVFGVKGVAWASGISMIVSVIILQIMILSKKDVQFNMVGLTKVPKRVYQVILSIGIPTAGENLSYNVANIAQTAMFSTLGTAVMSAHVYTQTIIRFAYSLSIAIGGATQIKTGYYVGAKQSETAYKKLYTYWILATISSVSLVGVCNLVKAPIIGLFTADPKVAGIVSTLMLCSFYIEFGRCMNLIFIGGLKGSGDIKFPVGYGFFSMWTIIVGLGWFLGLKMGLGILGFWLAVGTEETTRGIVMLLRWKSKRWMKHAIV